ncbi:MAG: flavodoxin [Firmicutes bacterium]|jgi:flavodoxin short chain|nr:flavodoxin [Bacillota bacterium]
MEKIAVIYWSGTGNTEAMANAIAEGIKNAGTEAEVFSVSDFVVDTLDSYKKIAFGCAAMGDEVLEEAEFEPFFCSVENKLSNKKVALFGSYGWGDGKWMRDWEERIPGAALFEEGLIVNGMPVGETKQQCVDFGKKFAEC